MEISILFFNPSLRLSSIQLVLYIFNQNIGLIGANKMALISEPVELSGEGSYNLNVLKEIKVTDSYLDMEESVRGCSDLDTLEICKSKLFEHTIKILQDNCSCLPVVYSDNVRSIVNKK